MGAILLMLICAWAIFRALTKSAGIAELAWFLLIICLGAFYQRFDQVIFYSRYVVLIMVVLLAILIINRLRLLGEGKPWAYAALVISGVLAYLGIVSNYMPGWRSTIANIDTPLWNGTFYVVQGGNNLLVNGHRISSRATAQRHALDLVKLSPVGSSATQLFPGDDLSNYVVYNEAVHAPCNGTVLLRDDRSADLPAGVSDQENPAGNYLAIGCDEGFTVVLAHLRREIHPSRGDRVVRGQYLGKVGNTGNTTEPHLHIHAVAGLVKDESEALFTGDGIPFTVNHTVLFKNTLLHIKDCPPVPGIDLWSVTHPRETKLSITRFSPALSKSMVSLLPSTALITP